MQLLHQVLHELDKALKEKFGISAAGYKACQVIKAQSPTMGGLTRAIGFAPSSVTPLVDGLEANGLVRRDRQNDDRRSIKLVLVDPDRLAKAEAFVNEVFAGMSAETERFLKQALSKIEAA